MRIRTAIRAGLFGSALALAPFGAVVANATDGSAPIKLAQASGAEAQARLEAALAALKEAQEAFRAAKKSGQGIDAAGERVRQAREEVKAARQAALATGLPADEPAAPERAERQRPDKPRWQKPQQAESPPEQTAPEQTPPEQAESKPPQQPRRLKPQQAESWPEQTAPEQTPPEQAERQRPDKPRWQKPQQAESWPEQPVIPQQAESPPEQAAPAKEPTQARPERRVPPLPAPVETTEQAQPVEPQPAASPQATVTIRDPQLRLQAAIAAEAEARKEFRAARKSGKNVGAARRKLRLAREELNAARQAVESQSPPAEAQAPTASPQLSQETAARQAPETRTGIAGERIDPQVIELQRKLHEERRRADEAEKAAAAAEAKAAGGRVVEQQKDRIIIRLGDQIIVRNQEETDRFLRHADDVQVFNLPGGRTRTIVTRRDGVKIITTTNRYGEIITRVRRLPNGEEIVLIDNRRQRDEPTFNVDIRLPRLVVPIPRDEYIVDLRRASRNDVYAALTARPVERVERVYSLDEVRYSERLRDKLPRVDLDTITFDSGSAAISRSQIATLTRIGEAMEDILLDDPDEVFLIEGHTDAVGSEIYNLALSDRRAESVAIVLSDYFEVPPENLITQGYGEGYLKIPTSGPERQNRRVAVRRITPLIRANVQ